MAVLSDSIGTCLKQEGDSSLSRRLNTDGGPILVLDSRSPAPPSGLLAKLHHEYSLRDRLRLPWSARPLRLTEEGGKVSLLLEDPGGTLLATVDTAPLSIAQRLRIAIGITSALSRVHAQGLIHKDIKPSNILVELESGRASLTGFGVATRLRREHQRIEPEEAVAGTLAYMAPEQTGRMNRPVDARSDLYSLGVVLYELFAGTVPFTVINPLDLVHCHIARVPEPLSRRQLGPNREPIPEALSAIVMKLLAKAAEERYQTARGLEVDLRRCLDDWERKGHLDAFRLAQHDVPDRLRLPEKLYGREKEQRELAEAFERVAEGGVPELVLVSGYPGVGKSALVSALSEQLASSRGMVASGKFEQYKRLPYAALAQVIQGLVRQVLIRPEPVVSSWKAAVEQAIAPSGQLLVELVPELEILIGRQPEVPELAPREAEIRLREVFRTFLSAFATHEHPLVLFFDDLQWLEPATLAVVEYLLTHPELRNLLVIGAYREGEVSEGHPLLQALDRLRSTDIKIREMTLSRLELRDVESLIVDMLHASRESVESLARLVDEKTGGNPFFVLQFLNTLHEEQLLTFDADEGRWIWDISGIDRKSYTDNVASLMSGKLLRLSTTAERAVKALACLGSRAPLEDLACVLGMDLEQAHRSGAEAESVSLVEWDGTGYAFVHDRIQEAAYSLIPPEALPGEHLRIGRLLLAAKSDAAVGEKLFEITDHFNRGLHLLVDDQERRIVRDLNRRAGKKAKAAVAHAAARGYFEHAAALLPENAWSEDLETAHGITLDLGECEFLVGNFERAEQLFRDVMKRSTPLHYRAAVQRLRARLYQGVGRYPDAIDAGFEGLALFSITFPEEQTEIEAAYAAELQEFSRTMAGRQMSDLIDADVCTDPNARAVIALFADLSTAVYILKPELCPLFILKGLKTALRCGNTEETSLIYVYCAVLRVGPLKDVATAVEFSEQALRLNERLGDGRLTGSLGMIHASALNHWRRPFATGLELNEQAFSASVEVGDLNYAGITVIQFVFIALAAGESIEKLLARAERALEFEKQIRNEPLFHLTRMIQQFLRCLRGWTREPGSFEEDGFKESESLAAVVDGGLAAGSFAYHQMKLIASFLFENGEAALHHALEAERSKHTAMSSLHGVHDCTPTFYHALTLAALYPSAPADQQREFMRTLDEQLSQLKLWADTCPENFLCWYALVLAEKARLEGRDVEAMQAYERAVSSARENGLVHIESLAYELAAKFYRARGLRESELAHVRGARAGYARWGALGKVEALDSLYPQVEKVEPLGATATMSAPVADLDLPNVLRASQIVSGEIELRRLIEALVRIVMDHAGAQRGLLILPKDDGFIITAEGMTKPEGVEVRLQSIPVAPGELCQPVFDYVQRTRESVILGDASATAMFASDEYVRCRKSRSILCIPLLKQKELVGVLYLENDLLRGAFTPKRVTTLNVLASQAAISLENARLYSELADQRGRLEAIIEQVPFGLIIAEAPSGRVIRANDQIRELTHHSFRLSGSIAEYEEYIGFHADGRRYAPEDWPLSRSIRAGEIVRSEEIEMHWPDGARGFLEVSSRPVRDSSGEISAAVVLIQDVTERRQREQALKASEERFSTAFHSNPTPMSVISADNWTILDANESFLSTLEYSRSKVIGHFSLDLGGWFAELLDDAARALAKGEPFRGVEVGAFASSGEPRTLLTSIDGIKVGGADCFLVSFVDLTEHNRVEALLRQSQKMDAIGSLAGGVAHDFNNLLTAINGYSEMLLTDVNASDEKYEPLLAIHESGLRAAALTRRLLAFSRKQAVQPKVVALSAIVANLEPMLRRLIEENVELSTHLAPLSARIHADPGQVEQILMNLVVNARDAMPKGGRIVITTDRVSLHGRETHALLDVPPGRYVVLSIADTGVGMTPEVQSKIFEPFFTTKEVGKGTGLGLAVVYGIVKQQGGTISVSSEPGRGSTFHVYFPEAQEASEAEAPPSEAPASRGDETVLVVEDEETVRKFMQYALGSHGYRVVEASHGREALTLVKQAGLKIQIVVTDMIMPDMTGDELARQIRAYSQSLPILYTSGYAGDMAPRQEDPAKSEYFISKPFGPSDLARKVRLALDRSTPETLVAGT